MSASAGRVLLIHKGDYSSETTYNPMDEVLYEGSTYVCKQTSTGNLPTNTAYWQLMAQKGADGSSGQGIPTGGTTGQVLTKHSNDDYDAEWSDPDAGIPDGGAIGQFLMKKSATDYDTEWGDALSIEEARENELIPGRNLAVFNPFVGTESSVSVSISDASTGELTLNGSASGSTIICISDPIANPSGSEDGSLNLKADTYVLSSPQYSALSASFYLAVVDKNGNKKASFQPQSASDDHVEFTLNSDTNGLFIAIYLSSGASFSSQTLQVMICTLADWNASHSYEPYTKPVNELIDDLSTGIEETLRSAEVVEGKNLAYSQENNAAIATIENGKSYKVRWTGSATITLKKDSASGTEVTSGSTSPLSFTADSDFDLYFGSSADVTEIMVYDGNDTDDTYVAYYVPVKDSKLDIKDQQVLGAWNLLENKGTTQTINGATFTKNDDDTVTVNVEGSAVSETAKYILSSTTDIYVPLPENIKPGNTYYFSGCEGGSSTEDGGIDTFFLWINFRDSNNTYVKHIIPTNGEKKFIVPSNAAFWEVGINIYSSAGKLTNKVFKPMISLEPNQPYVPYTMTNRELMGAITGIDTRLSVGTIVANSSLNDYYKTGDYYSNTGSNTATLSDKPSDLAGAFRLSVICANFPVGQGNNKTTSPITQKIKLINGATPCIYMRHKTGGGSTWGSWYKFTGTVVQ